MAGYLLWVDRSQAAGGEPLAACGLDDLVFHDNPPGVAAWSQPGPRGEPGMLLSWPLVKPPAVAPRVEYAPERQTWTPAPGPDGEPPRFWLGVERESPPTPADLARRKQYQGTEVKLEDGQRWLVPIARALPRRYGLARDGSWAMSPHPSFRKFCEATERVAATFVAWAEQVQAGGAADGGLNVPDALDYACQALALNYRLTRTLVGMLGLLGDESLLAVLTAPLELDLKIELQKKTTANTPATC